MTTYTTISGALVAVGAKPFATTIQALRDNPLAIAEGTSGSPVTAAGWHPYDSTVNGTGDGKIYDFAVSGAVSSVETPNFDAGYEYMFVFEGVTTSGGSTSIRAELYRSAAAAYAAVFAITPATSATYSGIVMMPLAQRTLKLHYIDARLDAEATNATATATGLLGVVKHTTATAIGKARFTPAGSTFGAGKIFMYRRTIK